MDFLFFFVLFPSVDILTPKKLLLLRDFLQTDQLYVKLREMPSRSLTIKSCFTLLLSWHFIHRNAAQH